MKRPLFALVCLVSLFLLSGMAQADTVLVKADPEAGLIYANPVWSPDGRSIAYAAVPREQMDRLAGEKPTRLHLAVLRGGVWQHKLLAKDADRPVWSPDGRKLAMRQGGLAVLDVRTGKTRRLTRDTTGPASDLSTYDYPVSWSPSGRYLMHAVQYQEGSRVTAMDTSTGRDQEFQIGDYEAMEHSFWVSDKRLLITAGMCLDTSEPRALLASVDATTGKWATVRSGLWGNSIFVPRGGNLAWAWVTERAPSGQGIYQVDLKPGKILKLLSVSALEWYWSPDGKQFAFIGRAVGKAGEQPQYTLYLGNTHNWFYTSLAKGVLPPDGKVFNRMRYAAWSPDSRSIAYVSGSGDIRIARAAAK